MDFTISHIRVLNHGPTHFYGSSINEDTKLKILKFQVFIKLGNFIKLLIHRSSINLIDNLKILKHAFQPVIE